MAIEGLLDIQLIMHSNAMHDVDIKSSRPVYASRVFAGKCVDESLTLLPLLFSICGVAQACAGVRACEQAQAIEVPEHIEQLRDKLVDMETLREHFWQILLNWPVLLEMLSADKQLSEQGIRTQQMAELIHCQQDYRQLLSAAHQPFLTQPDIPAADRENCLPIKKICALLEQAIFAMPPGRWLQLDSIEQLQHWFSSGDTIAARLLTAVAQNQWQAAGRNNIKALCPLSGEALDMSTLSAHFAHDNFVQQPQWQNVCYETGSLSRTDSPLLHEVSQQWGNGLMSRLVARLTEMAQIAQHLLSDRKKSVVLRDQSQGHPQGGGIGMARAARGLLIHQVFIEQGRLQQYQILAPTEWNFHPRGVVTQSLKCLQGNAAQLRQQAKLLLNAIDPCVAYKFHIISERKNNA